MSAWKGSTNADHRAFYEQRGADARKALLHYRTFPVTRRLEETLDIATDIRCSKVLDIGCGDGVLLDKFFMSHQATLEPMFGIGIDISCKRLNRAKGNGVQVLAADAIDLPFPPEQFDLVVCTEVLEHIPDVGKAVRELARVTTRGGSILISIPVTSWLRTILAMLGRRISYLDKDEHLREYSHIKLNGFERLAEFFQMTRDSGMVVRQSRGVYFYTQLGDLLLGSIHEKVPAVARILRYFDRFLGAVPFVKHFGRYLVLEMEKTSGA